MVFSLTSRLWAGSRDPCKRLRLPPRMRSLQSKSLSVRWTNSLAQRRRSVGIRLIRGSRGGKHWKKHSIPLDKCYESAWHESTVGYPCPCSCPSHHLELLRTAVKTRCNPKHVVCSPSPTSMCSFSHVLCFFVIPSSSLVADSNPLYHLFAMRDSLFHHLQFILTPLQAPRRLMRIFTLHPTNSSPTLQTLYLPPIPTIITEFPLRRSARLGICRMRCTIQQRGRR